MTRQIYIRLTWDDCSIWWWPICTQYESVVCFPDQGFGVWSQCFDCQVVAVSVKHRLRIGWPCHGIDGSRVLGQCRPGTRTREFFINVKSNYFVLWDQSQSLSTQPRSAAVILKCQSQLRFQRQLSTLCHFFLCWLGFVQKGACTCLVPCPAICKQ